MSCPAYYVLFFYLRYTLTNNYPKVKILNMFGLTKGLLLEEKKG
jgi:hypothetical protein